MKSLAWHKRQLAELRLIIAETDDALTGDMPPNKNLGQQFIGACRPINRAHIPAYHEPLANVLKGGAGLFGLMDNEHVQAALVQIKKEHKRLKAKKAKTAQKLSGSATSSLPHTADSGKPPGRTAGDPFGGDNDLSTDIRRETEEPQPHRPGL